MWDDRTARSVHTFHEPKGFGHALAFHPSGACVGVATSDSKVKVYDVRVMKLQQLYSAHTGPVSQVAFHPSGNYLVSASQDGTMKLYDLMEARPIFTLHGHDKAVTAVAFSSKGGGGGVAVCPCTLPLSSAVCPCTLPLSAACCPFPM